MRVHAELPPVAQLLFSFARPAESVGPFLVAAPLTGGARMTWRTRIKVSNLTRIQWLYAEILK